MSNDASGVLRVVSKKKENIERLLKILNYEDKDYCLYRCKYAKPVDEIHKDGEYYVQDIDVDGAWSCEPFYDHGDRPNEKVVIDYEKRDDGSIDYDKKIYGTAHFTDLRFLAKELDFGCELWDVETGCCFAEHICVWHNGEGDYESVSYDLVYPENEDGEEDYDAEPEEECEFGDELYEYADAEDIYGEGYEPEDCD